MTTPHPARRALAESACALAVGCVAAGLLLLTPQGGGLAGLARQALTAAVLLLALPMHWLALARCARHLGLPLRGWMLPAVLLCPLGGAAALLLLAAQPLPEARFGRAAA